MIHARGDMVVTRWGARFHGRRFPCSIGKGGISADKREGDGASPAGIWRLAGGGFRADRMARPWTGLALKPVGARDLWSDDIRDPDYNHWLSASRHEFSHERLRRADPLYDIFLVSDWNWPDAQPGRGSAIFVHAWRRARYPTAGCLAFAPEHLRWILARITPRTRLFVRG